MSEPTITVDAQGPAKPKNARKRALSTSDPAASAETSKPAKRSKATKKNLTVNLTGPFDILYTYSDFGEAYAPNGIGPATDNTPTVRDPEALYKMLLARQQVPGNTSVDGSNRFRCNKAWSAQVNIPADYQTQPIRGDVPFKNQTFEDPGIEFPFSLLATDFKNVAKPSFTTKYGRPPSPTGGVEAEAGDQVAWNAPGIKAVLKICAADWPMCGIVGHSGTFAMRPLWRKVGEDGEVMELFEGNATFKAKFNSMYSKKGFGKGVNYSFEFWAIRGKN